MVLLVSLYVLRSATALCHEQVQSSIAALEFQRHYSGMVLTMCRSASSNLALPRHACEPCRAAKKMHLSIHKIMLGSQAGCHLSTRFPSHLHQVLIKICHPIKMGGRTQKG